MATATFYHPELSDSDTVVTLSADESAHATKSKRLKAGAEIRLFNGKGRLAHGVIAKLDKRALQVEIVNMTQAAEPSIKIIIACAIPKSDRQRTMIDMLTQLGVSKIVPLHCDHSVTRFTDKIAGKWHRYAIEACKQSHNPWLPIFSQAMTPKTFISQSVPLNGVCFYADGEGESLANKGIEANSRILLVGPEGGFSEAEKTLFRDAAVKPIRLAGRILRTETAAVVAASVLAQ